MRILIVDDEPLARSRLARLCEEHTGLQIVAQADSGAAAIEAIRVHKPDLVLLDVELQDMTGFDVLRSVRLRDGPLAIMVTAHPEHAVEAFDSDAVHFLTKPVDGARLARAITRARGRLAPLDRAAGEPEPLAPPEPVQSHRTSGDSDAPRQITGEKNHRLYFIETETIDYIQSEANYVALHVGEERYVTRNTMKHMSEMLAPLGFVRIERSVLINLRRVAFAERLDRGTFAFTLRSGRRLESGATYRKGILNEITQGKLQGGPGTH